MQALITECDWFKVYDFIEAIAVQFRSARYDNRFADAMNEFFVEEGIGWQLIVGQILTRGPEAFETMVTEAASALETSKRPTAAGHLHEALQGFSRRPRPDLPGAAYHALGALECVARDLTATRRPPWAKSSNATLACFRSRWIPRSRRFGDTLPMKRGTSWRVGILAGTRQSFLSALRRRSALTSCATP